MHTSEIRWFESPFLEVFQGHVDVALRDTV